MSAFLMSKPDDETETFLRNLLRTGQRIVRTVHADMQGRSDCQFTES
jgi:hypothetical protein